MNKKTLVLGASLNSNRYSNYAIQRLVASSFEIVAFGLKKGEVSGVEINNELVSYDDVHTVTLYLNPIHQKDYFDYVVSLNPKRVIFNPGTENPDFYDVLNENNIAFESACTLVLLSTNQY